MWPAVGPPARRLARCIAAIALVVAMVGCQFFTAGADAQQRAQAVLAQWDKQMASEPPDAVIVTDGLVAGGGWSGDNADNDKVAFMAGLITANPALPSDQPSPGTVAWADGSTQTVELISAAQALDGLVAAATDHKCDGCTALTVTGARLTNESRPTARGTASVPVWQFEFAPADQPINPITYVAVKDATSFGTDSLPPDNANAWAIDDLLTAYGNAQSTSLTVAFVGSPYAGDNPCGADYGAQSVEFDRAVAIIVNETHRVVQLGACDAVGATRTAVSKLSRPLGQRVVLQIRFGTPVELKDEPPPVDQTTS